MPERAQVTSVEALESFRASLLTYLASARPTLDEMGAEVMRTRQWLEEDRQPYWEREVQRRSRLLQDAEALLFSARMSGLREATQAEITAVRKAKAAQEDAVERLRRVKKWSREFDSRIEPLARQLDSLRSLFTIEMPRAVTSLGRTVEMLSEYSGLQPSALTPPSAPADGPAPLVPPSPGGEP